MFDVDILFEATEEFGVCSLSGPIVKFTVSLAKVEEVSRLLLFSVLVVT